MVGILKTLGLPLGTSFIRNEAAAGGSLQARYDTVYAQCMTAKGNRIPAPYYWGGFSPNAGNHLPSIKRAKLGFLSFGVNSLRRGR
jgi:hypothetical protein